MDVIKDLEEPFNENIYQNAQEQLLQHGMENKADEILEVNQGSHDLLSSVLLKEVLIITESDIFLTNWVKSIIMHALHVILAQ